MKRMISLLVLMALVLGSGAAMAAEGANQTVWIGHVLNGPFDTLEYVDVGAHDATLENVVVATHAAGGHILLLPEGMTQADVFDRAVRYTLSDEDAELALERGELAQRLIEPVYFEIVGDCMTAHEVVREKDVLHCVRYDDDGAVIEERELYLVDWSKLHFDEIGLSLDRVFTPEEIRSGQQYEILYDDDTGEIFTMIATNG